MLTLEAGDPLKPAFALLCRKLQASCSGRSNTKFFGTVAHVRENGFGLRSVLGNGGSVAVCDRAFVANRHRSEKPV
ncbi:hypothetical protein QUA13_20595 [Microcoleus sp. S28C3]|uniref:hypothetical protein n=1 Tax=Microcoleus sp. S28C3 TaxID=3055414 RepID=UPI002FD31B3F